jgi:hypothetical protein
MGTPAVYASHRRYRHATSLVSPLHPITTLGHLPVVVMVAPTMREAVWHDLCLGPSCDVANTGAEAA